MTPAEPFGSGASELPPTERPNPRTTAIDTLDTAAMLTALLDEDARAVEAARAATGALAEAVELADRQLRAGGAIHSFGAGASGRLAVLDATELTPTFGVPRGLVRAHFPGGSAAVTDSSIDHEDAEESGAADAEGAGLGAYDLAIGVTASGSTPYVAGALRVARARGAATVLVTCNPRAALRSAADLAIVADTGPEALTGSTRLKAGTATKVLLNAFSTALMIRRGRTYGNLMTGLVATNAKLRARSVRLLVQATGLPEDTCRSALVAAEGETAVALVTLLAGGPIERARRAYADHGSVRAAVEALGGPTR